MNEVWKDIPGYEGLYQASDSGYVRGIKRQGSKGGILSPRTNRGGYLQVSLRKQGGVKSYLVHRLIAMTFLQEDSARVYVNHINGDKKDNRVENLEYCTASENASHRHYELNMNVKPVICVETGVEYPSIREAERQTGIGSGEISKCCRGVPRYKTAGGFHWIYKYEEDKHR